MNTIASNLWSGKGAAVSTQACGRVLVLAAVASAMLSCTEQRQAPTPPAGALAACRSAVARKAHDESAAACERAWSERPDAAVANHVSDALRALGSKERLSQWCTKLEGRRGAAHCARVWARVHLTDEPAVAAKGYARALELARTEDDALEQYESHYGLYSLARNSGDYRVQIQYLAAALAQAERLSDRRRQADVLAATAGVLQDLDDWRRADRALLMAAERYGDTRSELEWRVTFCNQHLGQGENALARRCCEDLLRAPAVREPRHAETLRGALLNLVQADIALGRLDEAELRFRELQGLTGSKTMSASVAVHAARLANARQRPAEAAEIASRALAGGGHPLWLSALDYEHGLALVALGRASEARAAFDRAASRAERVLSEAGLEALGLWLSSLRAPLEELFALQAGAGDLLGAVDTFERVRRGALVERIVRASDAFGANGVASVLVEGDERLSALSELLALLPHVDPAAGRRRKAPRTLLAALPRRRVLAYLRAGQRVFLLRFDGAAAPTVSTLATSAERLQADVRRFVDHPGDARAAQELGRVLLPPGSLPAAGEPVYVIADEHLALDRLPWAALRFGGRYLVDQHPIANAPSLHALAGADAGAPSDPITVVGDPAGNLPAAAQEAREIGARLRSEPLIGPRATRESVTRAPRAAVLHVATHTRSGPRGDELVLADGALGVEQILRARLSPRLTVLASCSSGAASRGSATGSLAQAFLTAGSPAVLASLWSVDDDATRRIARAFYDAGGAKQPLAALARVQTQSARDGVPVETWSSLALFVAGSRRQ